MEYDAGKCIECEINESIENFDTHKLNFGCNIPDCQKHVNRIFESVYLHTCVSLPGYKLTLIKLSVKVKLLKHKFIFVFFVSVSCAEIP